MLHNMLRAAAGASVDAVANFVAVSHSAFDATSLSLTNNDPVSTWPNNGTTGGDATQTSTARPTYIESGVNGQPVLRFDGANDYMQTAAWTALSQPNTTISVVKSAEGPGVIFDGIGSSNRHLLYATVGANWAAFAGSQIDGPAIDANWHIFVVRYNTASSAMYVDGGSAAVSGNIGSQTLTGITIGSAVSIAAFWGGDMHFIGIYDGDLYTDDLTQLNATCQALADRIGTTWTDIT